MKKKTPPYAEFAKRLFVAVKRHELRVGEEMDQKTLARRLGYSAGLVSSWFTGKRMPSVEQLRSIGELLDANPGWLTFGIQGVFMTPDGEELPASPPLDGPGDHLGTKKRGQK